MKNLSIAILLLIFYIQNVTFGQTKRIDSLLTSLQNDHILNGNVLVAEKGTITYQKSFGYANAESKVGNNPDTRFQLASIGKTFTAVAILQLKEKNKLKLDDPVNKYLPEFPFEKVTIRHLLSHTSGLPDLQIFDALTDAQPGMVIDNSKVVEALKKYGKLEFNPGENWRYSNPGYCILAVIVEKVSRLKFMDYLDQNIWYKAGMANTYPFSAASTKPDPLRAEGYRMPIYSYQLQKVDTMQRYKRLLINFGGLQGLGFIASTATDLFRFDRALSDGTLLKSGSLKDAYEPVRLNSGEQAMVEPGRLTFGLGWFIAIDTTGGKIVSHSGFLPGGATIFLRNLSKRQTVIVLDNAESDGLHRTGENLMNILTGKQLLAQKRSMIKAYASDLLTSGTDYAAAHLQTMRTDTVRFRFSPGEMDYAAHELNAAGYRAQALETLKLLTFMDSTAWQPYNSYAELLMVNGKRAEAKLMFQKSLSLNPNNSFAKDALAKLGAD